MSIDKSILLQKQLHNCTEDLKEENVEVQVAESQKTHHNKKSGKKKGKSKKISGSDYIAWHKLEVEAECVKMEVNKKEEYDSSDNEEYYKAEHITLRRDESLFEKELGNDCVRHKKSDDAIACYTNAIACFSNDPINFANRAFCYLKKNDFKSAKTDCTSALQLNPRYVKALQRRAAANMCLKQYKEAIIDLKRVLELEPHNTESKNQLLSVEKCVGSNKQAVSNKVDPVKKSADNDILNVKPSTSKCSVFESPPVKEIILWPNRESATLIEPLKKLPHQRSKKPLRRIEILESDSSEIVLRPLRSENELKTKTKNEPRNIDYSDSNALATILAQSKKDIEEILKGVDKLKYTRGSNSAASSKVELDYSGLSENANAEQKSELSITDTVKTTEKGARDIGTGIASNTTSNQNNKAALKSIEKNEEILKGVDKLKYTRGSNSAASSKVELDYSGLSENANAEQKSELSITDTVKTTEKGARDIGTGIASNTTSNQNNKAALKSIEKNEEIFHFKRPDSSVQFYSSWSAMKDNTDHKFMYLQKLNPTELPSLLKEYLKCDVISEIIHILKERYIKNNLDVFSYLLGLSKMKWFPVLIMLISHEDKLALNELFDYCIATANISIRTINKLKKIYEL